MDNAIVGLQVGKERPYHIIFMRGSRLLGTVGAQGGCKSGRSARPRVATERRSIRPAFATTRIMIGS